MTDEYTCTFHIQNDPDEPGRDCDQPAMAVYAIPETRALALCTKHNTVARVRYIERELGGYELWHAPIDEA